MTDFFYIQVPSDVKVLLLNGTLLQKTQIEQIGKCINILKLDLSNCQLSCIPNLQILTQLRILYLHQNQISTLNMENIINNQNLNYFTLFLNPISASNSLRRQVISLLKELWAFDFNAVTDEERYKDLQLKQGLDKSRLPWPILMTPKDTKNQQLVLQYVWQELEIIRQARQRCSTIIIIQKYIRSYLTKKKFKHLLKRKMQIQIYVKQAVKHWITFTRNKKDLRLLIEDNYKEQFSKVKEMVQNYKQRRGQAIKEIKSARIITRAFQRYFQKQKLIMSSIGSIYRVYIYKDQLSIFKKILQRISQNNQDAKQLIEQVPQQYEDFQKPNKIYQSEVFTYRLPNQWNLESNSDYFKNMITFPAQLAKISCCLQQLKLSVIRKWTSVTSFQKDINPYQYLQKYDELMPARKPYVIMYKMPKNEKLKYEKKLQQINKFQIREYNQLYMINLNKSIANLLIKLTLMHNKQDNNNLFILIFEKQLKEAVAALKIQRQFRSYLDVKKNGKSLLSIINVLAKERSLLILQKWFKDIKWYHRMNFFKSIAHRLKQIENNILYVNFSIYLNLKLCVSKLKFQEQNKDLSLINYNFQYQGLKTIPKWLLKQLNLCELENENNSILNNCDIYHLIHFDTNTEIISLYGNQYMKITFPQKDLKLRILLLAIFTYSFKWQGFVQLHQEQELLESPLMVEKKDQLILKIYKIDRTNQQIYNYKNNNNIQPIWLSTFMNQNAYKEISVRFYKNGIDGKKKKNISLLPGCEPIIQSLFVSMSKATCATASTNARTITQTDKPKTALQTFTFQQNLTEQESSTVERQLYRLKQISSNPSRQQYRSVTNKRQNINNNSSLCMNSFMLSQSFNKQKPEEDFSRQKQFWEDRQQQKKVEIKQQSKQAKSSKIRQENEKNFYLDFSAQQNLISKQGDRHLLKLRQKQNQIQLKEQVQLQQQSESHIKEIVKLNNQLKLQVLKEKIEVEQQIKQAIVPIIRQKPKTSHSVRFANKYIHSVLPEEIYPIKILNDI